MAAEVAVMNKAAIALAADSKVTVTSGGVTKTYDAVSKLFTLSKVHPVGIMIYGNAEFMSYLWETIIKIYRKQRGRDSERTVEDWSQSFFSFLDSFGDIKEGHRNFNVLSICSSTLHDALESFSRSPQAHGLPVGSDDYQVALRRSLTTRIRRLSKCQTWIPPRQHGALLKDLGPIIADAVESTMGEYSGETKKLALGLLGGTLLLETSSPQVSGVVIAGFGDDEYFPTLIEHRVDGYVGNRIKQYAVPPVIDLSRENVGCIRPFAQHEMVRRFMEGIDPFYGSYLNNGIPKLLRENCFSTLEKYGLKKNKSGKVRKEISDAINLAVKEFEESAIKFRAGQFSGPVMKMVSVLPKDELAHLAESLVALTSLKRRVSSDAETVGGPIDVALISKGDGFIWIKRKHYFTEELNPQFARTYLDGATNGAGHGTTRRIAKGRSG